MDPQLLAQLRPNFEQRDRAQGSPRAWRDLRLGLRLRAVRVRAPASWLRILDLVGTVGTVDHEVCAKRRRG